MGWTALARALREAWEEAGRIQGRNIESSRWGISDYDKACPRVSHARDAQVYLTRVRHIEDEYPRSTVRTRRWNAPERRQQNWLQNADLRKSF